MLARFFRRRSKTDFLDLLSQQANKTVEGLRALEEFARTNDRQFAERVVVLEEEEDELRRVLIDELNRTFVTPIDREDIFGLSRALDDVLDYAYSTVDEMQILQVEPTPNVLKMATILREAAEALSLAVQHLEERPALSAEHAVRAKSLENRVETLYREALIDLFSGAKSVEDVIYILKMRELYRHLSNAADRGDEAANVIGDIVVKTSAL